jgi:hypothetical protein
MSRTVHAIRSWNASTGEDTLCGIPHTHPEHIERSQLHEYVTCDPCRAPEDFDADRDEAPWPIPRTVSESTAQLQTRRARRDAAI